jgi:ATP-binding cassette subfamily F protein 3
MYYASVPLRYLKPLNVQIVGDDTTALSSVLKADVWRDHLLAEEARLNARLAELDAVPSGEVDARLEETRDEVSGRLAEVHTNLADMEAESGPARAAALLAGGLPIRFVVLLRGI